MCVLDWNRSVSARVIKNKIKMHAYIAPVPGRNPVKRRFTIIIIPDSDLFQSNTHLNSPGSIHHMLLYWCSTNHAHYHHILPGTHLWLSHPVTTWQHCSGGTSNPRPFGYGSYTLTNCAITVRRVIITQSLVANHLSAHWGHRTEFPHNYYIRGKLLSLLFESTQLYSLIFSIIW